MTTQHGTEWDKAHQAWQARQSQGKPTNSGTTLIGLGIASIVLAIVAALYENSQATRDNPFLRGNDATVADYTLALGLAGLGAFLLLLGVILRAGKS